MIEHVGLLIIVEDNGLGIGLDLHFHNDGI